MGVPQLFQWVFYRYPKAIRAAKKGEAGGVDCLYFDLNSVIHNCCHGSDPLPEGSSEDDMVLRIFQALDEVIELVGPKKLIYLSIDGVVPRGKLVQQRSRRFKESDEKKSDWDANKISPGTSFMKKIKDALTWFAYDRTNTDDIVKKTAFVISDSSVPGEGEQKIIEYMKELRETPGYDPNTTHCICSQDADLILLGLLAHTPHVMLLREYQEVRPPKFHQPRFRAKDTLNWDFVDLSTVREYIAADHCELQGIDLERCIDDFVLLCILMGSDFAPSLPSVTVKDGMLEAIIEYHKEHFHGHLIEGTEIRFDRLFYILDHLAQLEHLVFRARAGMMRHGVPDGEFDFTTTDYPQRYALKVGAKPDLAREYLQGIAWSVKYFFTGDASWEWCYPSPYPPLVSSLAIACRDFKPEPTVYAGPCLTPMETLLAILPKSSNSAVPKFLRLLTDTGAPLSHLHTVYVTEKLAGRTLTIASPVDTDKLKKIVAPLKKTFTALEKELDLLGNVVVFAHKDVLPGLVKLLPVTGGKRPLENEDEEPAALSTADVIGHNIVGTISACPTAVPLNGSYRLSWDLLDPTDELQVCCIHLKPSPHLQHHEALLANTVLPPKVLGATESLMGSEKVFPPIADLKPKY